MVAKRQVECMAGRITFLRGQPENWGTQQPITHPLFIFSLFSNVFHLHICKSAMWQYSDWGMCNRLTIDWGCNCLTFLHCELSSGIFYISAWQRLWLVAGFVYFHICCWQMWWLFSSVHFRMVYFISWQRWWLVAGFFSIMIYF